MTPQERKLQIRKIRVATENNQFPITFTDDSELYDKLYRDVVYQQKKRTGLNLVVSKTKGVAEWTINIA